MQFNKPLTIVCIPAYNEERTIAKVILLSQTWANKVVVCDDGSIDMTSDIATRLGAEVIKHEKNMGKGVALRTMFEYAKTLNPDAVITLDADGQHMPDEIPKLLEPILSEQADAVIGSRYIEGSWTDAPFYRKVGLRLVNFLCRKSGNSVVKDTQSGFRVYSKRAFDTVLQCEAKGFGIEAEQLATLVKNGFKIIEVPITVRYKGLEKTSKKNPLKHGTELISIALRLIVEERPLLLLGIPGSIAIIMGVISGVYLLWYFNITRVFSIPIALITLGALFTGIVLFITSLILYAIARLRYKPSNQ